MPIRLRRSFRLGTIRVFIQISSVPGKDVEREGGDLSACICDCAGFVEEYYNSMRF